MFASCAACISGASSVRRPGLVGVRDEAGIGRAPTHGTHARFVALAAELQFQQRQVADVRGLGGHGLGRVEAQRVGGEDRREAAASRTAPRQRAPELLASRSYKRAVERVAGGAGGSSVCSSVARRHACQCRSVRQALLSTVSP